MNEPVNPGDKVFIIVKNLDKWKPGNLLIEEREVLKFEVNAYNENRMYTTNGIYLNQWFLSKQEAKEKVLEYIKNQRARLDEMQSLLTD